MPISHKILSLADVVKYGHLEIEMSPSSPVDFKKFYSIENMWGRVDVLLNDDPESVFDQQNSEGLIKAYSIDVKRIMMEGERWRAREVKNRLKLFGLFNTDREFLVAFSKEVQTNEGYIQEND